MYSPLSIYKILFEVYPSDFNSSTWKQHDSIQKLLSILPVDPNVMAWLQSVGQDSFANAALDFKL